MSDSFLSAGNGIVRLFQARRGAHLLSLPPEILTLLAHKLVDDASAGSVTALLSLSRTCRVLRMVTDDEKLWVRCFHVYHQKILTAFFNGAIPEGADCSLSTKVFFSYFSKHWKQWAMDRAFRLNRRTRRDLIVISGVESRRSDFYKGKLGEYSDTWGVYDVTNFFAEHPGGAEALGAATKVVDASRLFSSAGHSNDARARLLRLVVPGLDKLKHHEAFGPSIHRCHHKPCAVLAPFRRWGGYICGSWNVLLVVLVTATVVRFNVDKYSHVTAVLDFAFDGPTVVAAVVGWGTVRQWKWWEWPFPAMSAVVLALHCGAVGLELVGFAVQLYQRPALPSVAIAAAWVTNRARSRRAAARVEELRRERDAEGRAAQEVAQEAEARKARRRRQQQQQQPRFAAAPEMLEGSSQEERAVREAAQSIARQAVARLAQYQQQEQPEM